MPILSRVVLLSAVPASLASVGRTQVTKDENGKVMQQMSIQAPSMSEEDQYGYNMPEQYRCDACKAVVFHLNENLQKKQPKNRDLKEWELEDLYEHTCTQESFKGYGVKLVNGKNALSGPGLPQEEQLEPGMGAIQMSSDTWSKRLGEICRTMVDDKVGEGRLYKEFRESNNKLWPDVCYEITKDCKVGPAEPAEKEDAAGKKKKVKKESKDSKKKKEAKKEDKKKEDKKREKKDKASEKETKAAEAKKAAATDAETGTCASDEPVNVDGFLTKLAAKHGVPADEYTGERNPKEWEQLLLRIAGRIYENSAASTA